MLNPLERLYFRNYEPEANLGANIHVDHCISCLGIQIVRNNWTKIGKFFFIPIVKHN